jgi:hypothetical protein
MGCEKCRRKFLAILILLVAKKAQNEIVDNN